jgi:hypothetical protein
MFVDFVKKLTDFQNKRIVTKIRTLKHNYLKFLAFTNLPWDDAR